ncbi:MAG: hypothetical protein RR263_03570 [Oscillospiraceae bacterium]
MNNNSQRPGVYSDYSVTPSLGRGVKVGTGAIVARGKGESAAMQTFTSLTQLMGNTAYTSGSTVLLAAELMFKSGVSKVYTISLGNSTDIPTTAAYKTAFTSLCSIADIGAIVTDCNDSVTLKAALAEIKQAGSGNTPRLIYGGGVGTTEVTTLAAALNNERCIICYPPTKVGIQTAAIFTAASFAAQVLTLQSPIYTLNWVELPYVNCEITLTETEVDTLINAGVTPFETKQGTTECIRAVTTASQEDKTLKSVNTILIIDHVMSYIRDNLEILLKDGKGRAMSADSIASQAAVLLSNKQDEGLISSFELPIVTASPDDPSVCTAQLAFKVSTVVSIIRIQATIRV